MLARLHADMAIRLELVQSAFSRRALAQLALSCRRAPLLTHAYRCEHARLSDVTGQGRLFGGLSSGLLFVCLGGMGRLLNKLRQRRGGADAGARAVVI